MKIAWKSASNIHWMFEQKFNNCDLFELKIKLRNTLIAI